MTEGEGSRAGQGLARWTRELPWALLPCLALLGALRPLLPTLRQGLWGPADPWTQGDFQGGWWLWWACSEAWRGRPRWDQLGWPDGAGPLAQIIPNPWDMALLGLTGPPSVLGWNLAQLLHLLLLLLASYALARASSASRPAAAAAGILLASSPVLLHEIAGGRPTGLIVWPGLLSLALLWRGQSWVSALLAGILAAAQGALYAWHGLALILLGLPLLRGRRRELIAAGAGVLAVLPYLIWLDQGGAAPPQDLPPAGYTSMPIAGLLEQGELPPRFQAPLLLTLVLLPGLLRRSCRPWAIGAVLVLIMSVGPWPRWAFEAPERAGPWAWVSWAWPPAQRLHHPVRATLLALPVCSVVLALWISPWIRDHRRGVLALAAALLLSLPRWEAMEQASSYLQASSPPFAELELPGEGPVIDLLGMPGRAALGLQTVHERPLREPLWFRRGESEIDRQLVSLTLGEPWPAGLADALRGLGFAYVLVLPRQESPHLEAILRHAAEALGEPVHPGIFPLSPSDEAESRGGG